MPITFIPRAFCFFLSSGAERYLPIYCSYEYRRLLDQFDLKVSMSGTGNCFDNAPMESFWGTLKQELVHHRRYSTRQEAARDITEYIEIFYNRQRRQARLGFLSPAAFAQRFYAGSMAAWMVWCPLLTSDLIFRQIKISTIHSYLIFK